MVGPLIGIVVGVAATIIVGHYYFQRSTRKSLMPYLLLNTRVFAGIDPDVRKDLHFSFRGEEVRELQHLQILVANDGERAISNVLEPLKLGLPSGHRVLDASILHKSPDSLQVSVNIEQAGDQSEVLVSRFPLLNKGEYFVVKLLLSGFIPSKELSFTVLADDLPRTLRPSWLPVDAMREHPSRIEWVPIVIGSVIVLIAAALGHALYILRQQRPELLPVPWAGFRPGAGTVSVAVAIAIAVLLVGIGVAVILAGFGGLMPKKAKFPLPKDLRRGAGFFRVGPHEDFSDLNVVVGEDLEEQAERPG